VALVLSSLKGSDETHNRQLSYMLGLRSSPHVSSHSPEVEYASGFLILLEVVS